MTSPLALLRVRFAGARDRTARIAVGGVRHVAELAGASGELRENITLLEGRNDIEVEVDGVKAEAVALVAPSTGQVRIEAPAAGALVATRATELSGSYAEVSCPAGVISVNGQLQQFGVRGTAGPIAEKVVLRPGANHIAVQVGEHYATRALQASFPAAKLLATLTWDTGGTDVDLYVTEPAGETVYYRQKTSGAGGSLDVDRQQGYGPENYSTGRAGAPLPPGAYVVRVHYYADRGVGRTEWTCHVIADELAPTQQRRLYYGILATSSSGNADPGGRGPDWEEVCTITVLRDGRVRLGPRGGGA